MVDFGGDEQFTASDRLNVKMEPQCNKGAPEDLHIMYSATGFLLPCCLCDSTKANHDHFAAIGFFDEELRVENNDNLIDIVTSDAWNEFYNSLEDNPSGFGLPPECLKFCGVPYVHNKAIL